MNMDAPWYAYVIGAVIVLVLILAALGYLGHQQNLKDLRARGDLIRAEDLIEGGHKGLFTDQGQHLKVYAVCPWDANGFRQVVVNTNQGIYRFGRGEMVVAYK